MKLRPDGKLEIDGASEDIGATLLALVKEAAAGRDVAVSWVRNLAAEHVRRIVAASEDGGVPSEQVRGAFLRCGMPRLEKLASRREYDVSSPVASLNSTLAPPPASNSPSFSADAGNGGRGKGRGDGPPAKGREERQIGRTLTGAHVEGQKMGKLQSGSGLTDETGI